MTSSDYAEAGGSNPREHHESSSPRTSQTEPAPAQETAASVPAISDIVAETPAAAMQPDHTNAAAANHPATGGESVAPVTAPTPTTSPPTDNADTIAPPPKSDATLMDTKEPKTAADSSSEPSDDSQGKEVEDAGPSLAITLLLTNTGKRHPFTIDRKYLRKQSINVENYDPFAMSVYTLKELIWRGWRSDWESRPTSPSFIRLISFGKMLEDNSPLSELKFNREAPNIIHMTVKPQDIVDEEDAKGAKTQFSRDRDANERSPGCRCVIL